MTADEMEARREKESEREFRRALREDEKQRREAELEIPATPRQIAYAQSLGIRLSPEASMAEASDAIDAVTSRSGSISPRQRMVLRFWGKNPPANWGRKQVSEWLTSWYDEDPRRLEAWEAYKRTAGISDTDSDFSRVPWNAAANQGREASPDAEAAVRIISQLQRPGALAEREKSPHVQASVPSQSASTGGSVGSTSRSPAIVGVVAVLAFAVLFSPLFYFFYWLNSPSGESSSPAVAVFSSDELFGASPETVNLGPGRIVARALHRHLLGILKDSASLEIVACTAPVAREMDGVRGWVVAVEYRSRNSFGGYVVERGTALIRNEKVEVWRSLER